jgi:hypothetical protein
MSFKISIETGHTQLWTLDPSYSALLPSNTPYDPNNSTSAQVVGDFSGFSGEFALNGYEYVDVVKV